MLTQEQVRQIGQALVQELTGGAGDALEEEIDRVVYRVDVTDCGDAVFTDRHIDIEYPFGEYFELREDSPLFQRIGTLCPLPPMEEEGEAVLYES